MLFKSFFIMAVSVLFFGSIAAQTYTIYEGEGEATLRNGRIIKGYFHAYKHRPFRPESCVWP